MHRFSSNSSTDTPQRNPIFVLIPVLIAVTLLSLSIWTIYHQLQQYPLADVTQSIAAIPGRSLTWAIALAALNYLTLPLCDALAVRLLRRPLPIHQTTLAGAISYGISNTIGFAFLSDTAIRYRFYSRWLFSAKEVAQIVVFCHLSFWLGLFTVGGVIFLTQPLAIPSALKLPFSSAYVLGGLSVVIIGAYLLWNWLGHRSMRLGKWALPHIPIHLSLVQIAIASLNWMVAVGVLYVLLPPTASPSYVSFFGIYLLAQVTSIISSVPGGLGVFESVVLLLLSPQVNSATLLGTLLAYRGINYFLPLLVSASLFGLYELRQRLKPAR